MTQPKPEHTFSYADYLTWPEEQRWELLDGVPSLQATPSRIHQEISGELYRQLANYFRGKSSRVYHAPFCVRLDGEKKDMEVKNVVEPDISIVCDRSKLDEKGCRGAPDLIIEIVSPSSGKLDKLIKFNKYEQAGVKEYWIVEPLEKLVSVFVLQTNGRYGRPETYTDEDTVKVSTLGDLTIDLPSVFPQEEETPESGPPS
jgi:Uma2 family endonuclease